MRPHCSSRRISRRAIFFVLILAFGLASPVVALDYQGGAFQFAAGFNPSNAPQGGFGGGNCTVVRTPVVFIHGNGDEARNWDFPTSSTGVTTTSILRIGRSSTLPVAMETA